MLLTHIKPTLVPGCRRHLCGNVQYRQRYQRTEGSSREQRLSMLVPRNPQFAEQQTPKERDQLVVLVSRKIHWTTGSRLAAALDALGATGGVWSSENPRPCQLPQMASLRGRIPPECGHGVRL